MTNILSMPSDQKNTGLIVGMVAIAVVIFAGLTWAVLRAPSDNGSGNGEDNGPVTFADADDPVQGPADAKAVVHLYSDFQCPACRSAEPGVAYAMQKYADRVRFVWKDFPLEQIHKNARAGANAARCAQAQGKFWEYHNVLYDKQAEWSNQGDPTATLEQYARDLGLTGDAFAACLQGKTEDAKVAQDVSEGLRNRVDRTPTFFVNNQRLFGMSPKEWEGALDAVLSTAAATGTR